MLPILALTALLAPPANDPRPAPGASAESFQPGPPWKDQGRSLWFDPQGRRVLIRARVVLREGYLEHLLCLVRSKEHESILATDADPRRIHAALLLTGAEPGHPVQFLPGFQPPAGPPIAIQAEWTGPDGQVRRADARRWVKDEKTGRPLAVGWVFAGSTLGEDPDTGRVIYGAQSGDLITVANFMGAILDLPFASSATDAERSFVANTPEIPPLGTPVRLILAPAQPAPPRP